MIENRTKSTDGYEHALCVIGVNSSLFKDVKKVRCKRWDSTFCDY